MLDVLLLQASTKARSALGLPLFVSAREFHGSVCSSDSHSTTVCVTRTGRCCCSTPQLGVLPLLELELNEATGIK